MRHFQTVASTAVGALMLLAVPGPAVAQQTDIELMQEMRDRAQIEQLMWNYVRAIDGFDAEAYVAVFTPDGAFNTTKGSEALRKMVVDMKQGQDARRAKGEHIPPMHHFMSNQTIEFVGPDHARVHYYWQTVFADRTLDPPPRLAAAGRGMDDVVRVDGKWLIRSRNVAVQD